MTDVLPPSGQVADAAKVLEKGDTVPKIMDSEEKETIVPKEEATETKAPPSTPTKSDDQEAKKKIQTFQHFPKFKVTWDSSIPSLMSLKSPGKKKLRSSQSTMIERPSVLTAQEMSPQTALVEFISTSASYHGVKRQNLGNLEDDLFRVFRNNVMPANAAAWYMAKRRFYVKSQSPSQSQLLPMLLKEYPKKFALQNNVVQFLESYSPTVAQVKMRYLVEQGLFAYFSHKCDEYGVYFFDPLYYEETEPFHANLRMVTNIYNNQKAKLVSGYFKKYKKQFHFKQITPYLAAIMKTETEIVTNVTGVVVTMFDKKYGLIRFNRNTESCLALFSTSALYQNGYQLNVDPKTLPPVFFDAYKIPDNDRVDKFKWFAVLTWVGRRPNPKFCTTKDELMSCPQYKMTLLHEKQAPPSKKQDEIDYMKMGIVKEIRKNGAVAVVKDEGQEEEQKYFIPGWSFSHVNTSRVKFMTTTQGIGLSVGDLVNFYIDPHLTAKPYDAVACNVDVLKHANVPADKVSKGRGRKKSTSVSKDGLKKSPPVSWKKFLMTEEIVADEPDEEAAKAKDPDWVPPENYEDSEDAESDISEDEIKDLAEDLKTEPVAPPKSPVKVDAEEKKQESENSAAPEQASIEASEKAPEKTEEAAKPPPNAEEVD